MPVALPDSVVLKSLGKNEALGKTEAGRSTYTYETWGRAARTLLSRARAFEN